MIKNKKGQGLKGLFIVIISLIFFLSTYPFFQGSFDEAASLQTGTLAAAIQFIPFIVLFGLIVWSIRLGDTGA